MVCSPDQLFVFFMKYNIKSSLLLAQKARVLSFWTHLEQKKTQIIQL